MKKIFKFLQVAFLATASTTFVSCEKDTTPETGGDDSQQIIFNTNEIGNRDRVIEMIGLHNWKKCIAVLKVWVDGHDCVSLTI